MNMQAKGLSIILTNGIQKNIKRIPYRKDRISDEIILLIYVCQAQTD